MPNLHDIQRRINSVNSTKQITRTMEMVSAAKIRRATERVTEATPYAESMIEMLGNVTARAGKQSNPLLDKHEDFKSILFIAVVSDRGLAGGFNTNVLRTVEKRIRVLEAEGVKCHVIACGKKALSFFNFRGIDMEMTFTDLSADPTFDEASTIASRAIEGYIDQTYDKVVILYNHAKNAAEQTLEIETVLPVDEMAVAAAEFLEQAEEEAKTGVPSGDVDFEPEPEDVLDNLLPAFVRTVIYHALIDSAAGEQGARRNAMKNATDNANEMVETLERYYNRVRQGAITTELNEIVGGAAALEE